MGKFTLSVLINRSQQDVFDLSNNPVNCQRGMPIMQSATWASSGEPRIGTTGSCERTYAHA